MSASFVREYQLDDDTKVRCRVFPERNVEVNLRHGFVRCLNPKCGRTWRLKDPETLARGWWNCPEGCNPAPAPASN